MTHEPISFPKRKTLPHASPVSTWDAVYFISINTAERGANVLARQEIAPGLWKEWCGYAERQQCGCGLFLVMPDHVHGFFRFLPEPGMMRVVCAWKRLTSGRYGITWQRDFFDHRLRNDESFDEKAAYIRNNPVRKGLVREADEWPYVWPKQT